MNSEEQQPLCSRFTEPEKLVDLRTKQEIEVMNGRPWTRELPPPPVLPPYGPLEKISGRLESFSYERFREYFDATAYRTSTLPEVSDSQRGAAAAVAIAAGSPGAGAAIMAESDSDNCSSEYVRGVINGKPFRGWVGVTCVRAGDHVEMAVEWQHDHYEVYAIALPDERIISMCPECDMGHIAHAWWRIKNMLILTAVMMFISMFMLMLGDFFRGGDFCNYWDDYHIVIFMMLAGALGVSGLIAFFAYKSCAPTRCKLTEEILILFGKESVARVNLKTITKEREVLLKEKGEWHDPSDQTHPPRPSMKFCYTLEHWFYY